MIINIGKRAMFDTSFELFKEDVHSRVDQSHIYDLRIYKGNHGYNILMFAHKEDRDIVYDGIVEAMKENNSYDCDLFDLYDVEVQ